MLLKDADAEVHLLLKEEEKRQKNTLNLIASENYANDVTLKVQGSIFSNKLAEGYIGSRVCAGCEVVDKLEKLAIDRAKELFKADHVNVQCPTATQANVAVYTALLNPDDTVLAPKVSHGGHFSHGSRRHISSRICKFDYYGVSKETERIDFENLMRVAEERRPKLIIAGMSAYPRLIDFSEFRKVADTVGSFLMADIAHVVGLVIANLHPDPVPHSDVVTTSTHKTFGGPRGGGIILCKEHLGRVIDEVVFPGTQGAPLMNVIASRAVLFKQARSPKFTKLQNQIVENAKTLATTLITNKIRLVTGGTDNHLILIDLRPLSLDGSEAEKMLYSAGIAANKNSIPFDETPAHITSGLRLGSVALTTRGMKRKEMEKIGNYVSQILLQPKSHSVLEEVRKEVTSLGREFPLVSHEWEF